jgi:hypothetical protein
LLVVWANRFIDSLNETPNKPSKSGSSLASSGGRARRTRAKGLDDLSEESFHLVLKLFTVADSGTLEEALDEVGIPEFDDDDDDPGSGSDEPNKETARLRMQVQSLEKELTELKAEVLDIYDE